MHWSPSMYASTPVLFNSVAWPNLQRIWSWKGMMLIETYVARMIRIIARTWRYRHDLEVGSWSSIWIWDFFSVRSLSWMMCCPIFSSRNEDLINGEDSEASELPIFCFKAKKQARNDGLSKWSVNKYIFFRGLIGQGVLDQSWPSGEVKILIVVVDMSLSGELDNLGIVNYLSFILNKCSRKIAATPNDKCVWESVYQISRLSWDWWYLKIYFAKQIDS